MTISFTDIDSQASQLKKARAVLSLVVDALPNDAETEDYGWAISTAHSIVHDAIRALEKVVNDDLNAQRAHGRLEGQS
ncbi:hypothetical protein BSQ98_25525 [Serratia liquefaciens]|uniref:hypothetical protein n=1 Tax=Serratia liquefaciens TaxID=614 RepID=UPI00101F9747|nr:hypothetical protein [Serratia liquefaciens]RYM57876.1 hypothetical protein BSQ98_25525 [Serratia liquefaciens]